MQGSMVLNISLIAFTLILSSCRGNTGPQGPVGPPGANSSSIYVGGDNQAINLSSSPRVLRQIGMKVVGPGLIIFQASGYFYLSDQIHDKNFIARASWSLNDTAIDRSYLCVAEGDSSIIFNPYFVSRSLKADTAGTYTVYLLADLSHGDSVQAVKNSAIVTFTPN